MPTVRNVTDTLDAYIDKYTSLVPYLADNATNGFLPLPPSDAAPPDLSSKQFSLRVGCLYPDLVPLTLGPAFLSDTRPF
jgi:neutral ceramidase